MSEPARYEASFKKVPGTLTLTATHIAWVPAVASAMDRQHQALNRVINMLASKAGSARVSLMLKFKDDKPQGGLLFTFTGKNKEAERQAVQDVLIPFVSAHRAAAAGGTGGGGTPSSSGGGGTGPKGTPSSAAAAAGGSGSTPAAAGVSGGGSGGGSAAGTPAGSTPGTPSGGVSRKRKADDGDAAARRLTNKLRERVLRKNPTLKLLHRELVIAKQITEDEFWDGREAMLKAEELEYAQQPGRPSRILDDRFLGGSRDDGKIVGGTGVGVKKADSGPTVLNITAEIVREIFEEFPVVQDAYAKHVPGISETEFWRRYFTSTLWERHRASVRQSALDEGARRKDDIFDAYLEDPDWESAPRKQLPDTVESYLNLAATEEDHGESTIVRDVTMQAGKERASLPLIRRFNDHSDKLLNGARSKAPGSLPLVADDLYDQIEYDDLRAPAAPEPIPLEVVDAKTDDATPRGLLPGRTDADLLALADAQTAPLARWTADFNAVCLPNPANPTNAPGRDPAASPLRGDGYDAFAYQRDAQAVASRVVRDMHLASNAEDAALAPLPDQIRDAMRSCHTAATEFLRQYWAAILPAAPGALGAGTAAHSPAARSARATKMARYLDGTEGKVNAIIDTAVIARADPERVRAAMAPTLGAVNVALRRERLRVGSK